MRLNKSSLAVVLTLGGLVACLNYATAQDSKEGKAPPPGGKRNMPSVQERLDKMSEELKLTDDQKPKVKAVMEDAGKKMQEIRSDSSLDRDKRREKFEEMRKEETKKMKEILTPDQYTKWEKMREQMRPGRGPGGPGGPGGDKK